MKLYRLTVTYETVVAAESEAQAVSEAHSIIKLSDFDDDPQEVDALEITDIPALPFGWEPGYIPWNQPDDGAKTIRQILTENESCNP